MRLPIPGRAGLRPTTAAELLREARRVSPLPGIAATAGVVLAAVALAAVAPWGAATYLVLVVAACSAGTLLSYWAGPLWGVRRRRWLLAIAERAAYGYLALRPGALGVPERRRLVHPPDVDEVLELTLRLEGSAPFLLRPGERDWLRATTALLVQCERGGAL